MRSSLKTAPVNWLCLHGIHEYALLGLALATLTLTERMEVTKFMQCFGYVA